MDIASPKNILKPINIIEPITAIIKDNRTILNTLLIALLNTFVKLVTFDVCLFYFVQ